MDQTTSTAINATTDFLNAQIVAKDSRIQSLEENIQRITQRDYQNSSALQSMRDAMHEWTMKELQDNGITEDQASEIADICGFELTKEVEVEVTVIYNITLQVPHDEDAESIINDIDFESVSYNSDNITWLSSSVDRIDFQQGATNRDLPNVFKLGKGPEHGHVNCSLFIPEKLHVGPVDNSVDKFKIM